MAMIHEKSRPSVCSEVDLFSLPCTDTSIETSLYAEYKPIINIQDTSAKLEFRILGNSNTYLDCDDSFIHIKLKVVKPDGGDLAAAADISTSNNLLHSLFSQCEVYLNSQIVDTSNNCYAYRAYLGTLFKYAHGNKTELETSLFKLDSAELKSANSNVGFQYRKDKIKESKVLELCGKLCFDLAYQKRFILNNTSMSIVLTRSSDAFSLLCPKAGSATPELGKIQLLDATFCIRRHVLYPSITLSHQKLLEMGNNAKYPYIGSDIRYFTISKGNQSFLEENVFMSNVPSRIILGMIKNSNFIGDVLQNPYKFEHFDISSLNLMVNNISIPTRPLKLDFTNNDTMVAYHLLNKCASKMNNEQGLIFDHSSFINGFSLFGYDINPLDFTDSTLILEKPGSVKIEISFSKALPDAVTLIVYSEHQRVLEIDKQRKVSVQ